MSRTVKRLVVDGRVIRLVDCGDVGRGSWGPKREILVDDVPRGWVAYLRISLFSTPAGYYVWSRHPRHEGQSTAWYVAHGYDLPKLLANLPTWIEGDRLPSDAELPAVLQREAEAEERLRQERAAEDAKHRQLLDRMAANRRQSDAAEARRKAEVEANRAHAVEALKSIFTTKTVMISNFEMEGVALALKLLGAA